MWFLDKIWFGKSKPQNPYEHLPKSVKEKVNFKEDMQLIKNTRWIIDDETWYIYDKKDKKYYSIWKFHYYTPKQKLTTQYLQKQWYNPEDVILYFANNKYHYILPNDYEQTPIVSKEILDTMSNKSLVLNLLEKDVIRKYSRVNIDKTLEKIKNVTEDITEDLDTPDQKIGAIYDYILKHSKYIDPIPKDDDRIYSWLEMFTRGTGVCNSYAVLFIYMLSFAGIQNVQYRVRHLFQLTGWLDPKIPHAWASIWDKYYDPTWDDPTFSKKDKKPGEYKYFWLPKDIMYADRADGSKENDAKSIYFKKNTSGKYILTQKVMPLISPEYLQKQGMKVYSSESFISSGKYWVLTNDEQNIQYFSSEKWRKEIKDNNYLLYYDKTQKKYMLTQKVMPILQERDIINAFDTVYSSYEYGYKNGYTFTDDKVNIDYISRKWIDWIKREWFVLFFNEKTKKYAIVKKEDLIR